MKFFNMLLQHAQPEFYNSPQECQLILVVLGIAAALLLSQENTRKHQVGGGCSIAPSSADQNRTQIDSTSESPVSSTNRMLHLWRDTYLPSLSEEKCALAMVSTGSTSASGSAVVSIPLRKVSVHRFGEGMASKETVSPCFRRSLSGKWQAV